MRCFFVANWLIASTAFGLLWSLESQRQKMCFQQLLSSYYCIFFLAPLSGLAKKEREGEKKNLDFFLLAVLVFASESGVVMDAAIIWW